ncbi:MAG: flagellar biosynthesis protein FlhB [Planctomycetota bacterium]
MADAGDRTIPATPKRREAARREGLAPTAALPAWAAAAGAAILLLPGWARGTIPAAAEAFRAAAGAVVTGGDIPWPAPLAVIGPTIWLVAASAAAGLAVRAACDGVSWRPERAGFDLRRIDPIRGLGRIFSSGTLVAMLGATAGLGVILFAASLAGRRLFRLLEVGLGIDAAAVGGIAWQALAWLVAGAAVVAAAQWAWARRRFEHRIRMTPQELAEEAKDMQADPRVRLLHQQRSRR